MGAEWKVKQKKFVGELIICEWGCKLKLFDMFVGCDGEEGECAELWAYVPQWVHSGVDVWEGDMSSMQKGSIKMITN